ncbi:MAG: hypothetical protein M0R21_00420 [Lentimicrobiaceae bacterium]|nr:hypothetical protein [Lentimicrobiaceae bacterium]
MPAKSIKKKSKKVKFKKIIFKLSEKQKKVIDKYCKLHKTTPNKFYKKALMQYLLNYASLSPDDEYYISENQLKLFDENETEVIVEEADSGMF